KQVELPHILFAPVYQGDRLGRVRYFQSGACIGELPLYAAEDVALYVKPTLWERIRAFFRQIT
ncbi:MAG: hypothetical protein MJ175_13360, partial [Clostridia bacterium]|nr:hypothetical protein [Clostridia bacterium]